jgi:hypothetical protein
MFIIALFVLWMRSSLLMRRGRLRGGAFSLTTLKAHQIMGPLVFDLMILQTSAYLVVGMLCHGHKAVCAWTLVLRLWELNSLAVLR